MIKQLLTVMAALAICQAASAQITLTMTDMPVAGDTPRHSIVNPAGATLNLTNTGANIAWNYSTLVPVSQTIDTYKTSTQAGYTISGTPTGFKVADTLDLTAAGAPVALTNVYSFFSNTAASYNMTQLAAKGGLLGNVIISYTGNPDEMVNFPLTYNRIDTTSYLGAYTNILIGALVITGKRYSKCDGWGTIVTPNSSTPVNVLRLRSETIEKDSFALTGQQATVITRHMVTYQWFANGVHTPIMMITTDASTTQETPTSVMFQDHYRPGLSNLSVGNTPAAITALTAYPNPSASGVFHVNVPADWKTYAMDVYDVAGKLSATSTNNATLDIKTLPSGNYIVRVRSGASIGYVRIAK